MAAKFSGQHQISKDQNGRYFLDFDGDTFTHILNYLRHGRLPPVHKSVEVYELSVILGIWSLARNLEVYFPVHQKLSSGKIRSLYRTYSTIFEKIRKAIVTRNVQENDFSINIPIYTQEQNCCSSCTGEGVGINVVPEDPGCSGLRFLIGEDLKARGFDCDVSQTACTKDNHALLVFNLGPCECPIITINVKQ